MKLFLYFLLIFSASISHGQLRPVEHVFTFQGDPVTVEGMTYDPVDQVFYFGSDNEYKILKYGIDGKALGYIDGKANGMTSVLGMSISKERHLWVCGAIGKDSLKVRCIFQFDLKSGKLLGKYPDTSKKAKLFNDITITSDGNVFCTDTYSTAVYKVNVNKKITEVFTQSDLLADGNGITTDGKFLYVSVARGIAKLDPQTKEVLLIDDGRWYLAGYDGIYFGDNSIVGIQNCFVPACVNRFYLDATKTKFERMVTLSAADPAYYTPTTGYVIGDWLYFMGVNNIGVKKEQKKNMTIVRLPVK